MCQYDQQKVAIGACMVINNNKNIAALRYKVTYRVWCIMLLIAQLEECLPVKWKVAGLNLACGIVHQTYLWLAISDFSKITVCLYST